jgi:hypothetical protein
MLALALLNSKTSQVENFRIVTNPSSTKKTCSHNGAQGFSWIAKEASQLRVFARNLGRTHFTFFHPDCTVGLGVSPNQSPLETIKRGVAG